MFRYSFCKARRISGLLHKLDFSAIDRKISELVSLYQITSNVRTFCDFEHFIFVDISFFLGIDAKKESIFSFWTL